MGGPALAAGSLRVEQFFGSKVSLSSSISLGWNEPESLACPGKRKEKPVTLLP